MKKAILVLLGVVALGLTVTGPANAIVGTNVHPYDGQSQGSAPTYPGFSYTGASTLCSYNRFGYPPDPRSTGCVEYAPGGSATITATDPLHWFTGVSGWCATAAPFANPNGISIEATGVDSLVTKVSCKSNYGSGVAFSLTVTGLPATSLKIHDTGNYFIWDHLTFTSLV